MSDLHPNVAAFVRLAAANDHGPLGTPESNANFERAMALIIPGIPPCPHCDVIPAPVPLAAQRWGYEHNHDPDCPDSD
jgi:hypothetical protein